MTFLARKTLLRIGLHSTFVDIIMTRTTSISYSFLMNGTQFGLLQPSWGIRQGDPLSPHLFICVVEAFLALIRQAEHRGDIRGVRVARQALALLLFASQTILSCSVEQMSQTQRCSKIFLTSTHWCRAK